MLIREKIVYDKDIKNVSEKEKGIEKEIAALLMAAAMTAGLISGCSSSTDTSRIHGSECI